MTYDSPVLLGVKCVAFSGSDFVTVAHSPHERRVGLLYNRVKPEEEQKTAAVLSISRVRSTGELGMNMASIHTVDEAASILW